MHKDHLGSLQSISDENGNLLEELSFDAWGKRRGIDGTPLSGGTNFQFNRGFTGHEHIDLFSLVNMDGRVYDPVIARFLSADPIIPDLTNLQALNRYSYVYNSPLNYIDPDGHAPVPWLASVAVGAAIGGGVSAYVAQQNGASPMQMFAAGIGGAIVGGLAGYGAYSVATKGVSLGIVGKGVKSGLRTMESTVAHSGQFFASASGKFLTSTTANHLIDLQYTSAQDGGGKLLKESFQFENVGSNWREASVTGLTLSYENPAKPGSYKAVNFSITVGSPIKLNDNIYIRVADLQRFAAEAANYTAIGFGTGAALTDGKIYTSAVIQNLFAAAFQQNLNNSLGSYLGVENTGVRVNARLSGKVTPHKAVWGPWSFQEKLGLLWKQLW